MQNAAATQSDEIDAQMLVTSDLLAAFLVAYEEYRNEATADGGALTLALTPSELVTRHRAIGAKRIGDKIEVYFFPATSGIRGGGIRYLVDPKAMRVVERTFDR